MPLIILFKKIGNSFFVNDKLKTIKKVDETVEIDDLVHGDSITIIYSYIQKMAYLFVILPIRVGKEGRIYHLLGNGSKIRIDAEILEYIQKKYPNFLIFFNNFVYEKFSGYLEISAGDRTKIEIIDLLTGLFLLFGTPLLFTGISETSDIIVRLTIWTALTLLFLYYSILFRIQFRRDLDSIIKEKLGEIA